jgi:undecaprenyl-diphosphatase
MLDEADDQETTAGWVRRWRLESFRIAVSLVVLLIATALATDPPAAWETSMFRTINDLTSWWGWVLWLIAQAGFVLAIPVAAAILYFLARHWRPSATLLVGGLVFSSLGTRIIKEVVDRGRPGQLLTDVKFGYGIPMSGPGYPSGHTAVAFTIAAMLSPYVPRWLRWTLYAIAALVVFSRIYMGAHLPLDVVGGAAYGLIVGSALNLVSGIRVDRARPEALANDMTPTP